MFESNVIIPFTSPYVRLERPPMSRPPRKRQQMCNDYQTATGIQQIDDYMLRVCNCHYNASCRPLSIQHPMQMPAVKAMATAKATKAMQTYEMQNFSAGATTTLGDRPVHVACNTDNTTSANKADRNTTLKTEVTKKDTKSSKNRKTHKRRAKALAAPRPREPAESASSRELTQHHRPGPVLQQAEMQHQDITLKKQIFEGAKSVHLNELTKRSFCVFAAAVNIILKRFKPKMYNAFGVSTKENLQGLERMPSSRQTETKSTETKPTEQAAIESEAAESAQNQDLKVSLSQTVIHTFSETKTVTSTQETQTSTEYACDTLTVEPRKDANLTKTDTTMDIFKIVYMSPLSRESLHTQNSCKKVLFLPTISVAPTEQSSMDLSSVHSVKVLRELAGKSAASISRISEKSIPPSVIALHHSRIHTIVSKLKSKNQSEKDFDPPKLEEQERLVQTSHDKELILNDAAARTSRDRVAPQLPQIISNILHEQTMHFDTTKPAKHAPPRHCHSATPAIESPVPSNSKQLRRGCSRTVRRKRAAAASQAPAEPKTHCVSCRDVLHPPSEPMKPYMIELIQQNRRADLKQYYRQRYSQAQQQIQHKREKLLSPSPQLEKVRRFEQMEQIVRSDIKEKIQSLRHQLKHNYKFLSHFDYVVDTLGEPGSLHLGCQ